MKSNNVLAQISITGENQFMRRAIEKRNNLLFILSPYLKA